MADRPYLAEVEEFFVSVIRKGLMLRARDVDAVRDWEARGVPLDVVRQGILTGVRRFLEGADPAAPLPSSLGYYRTFVEAAFATWQRATGLQRTFQAVRSQPRPVSPVERALSILEGLASRAETPEAARRFESAAAHLRDLIARGVGPAEALDATDHFLVQTVLEEAPPPVRRRVEERVRARVREAARRGLGETALRDIERAEARAAVAEEMGFEGLVAKVIESS